MRQTTPTYHAARSGRLHTKTAWELPRGSVPARLIVVASSYRTVDGTHGGGYTEGTTWRVHPGTRYHAGADTRSRRYRVATRHASKGH